MAMKRHTTVYVDWSCPDDGTDNYDRDIRIEVRCHPGSAGHTDPHYDCAGCPPEPPEYEIIGAIFIDDKKPLPESTMDKMFADEKYVNRIEEMASELAWQDDESY
jgi:hypothetical protein